MTSTSTVERSTSKKLNLSLKKNNVTTSPLETSGPSIDENSFATSTPKTDRVNFEKFLFNCLAEIKKPPLVHDSTSLLAQELAKSDNVWCREIRDYDIKKKHATTQWTRQQDADLVALALAHSSSGHDMRNIETYRSIKVQFLDGIQSPEELRYRLNYLCHEKNKILLENLSGYINSNVELSDAKKSMNEDVKKAVRLLRAGVLRVEDVDRWNLLEDMKYYIETRKRIGSNERHRLINDFKNFM